MDCMSILGGSSMSIRRITNILGFAIAGVVATAGAALADWPERPVTLIVPAAAGGGTDATVRVLAEQLTERLGQPFTVVNRTGGGGIVGHSAIAEAAPDGYTLGAIYFELSAYEKLGQSDITFERFTPIALYNADPAGFQVNADSPFQTLGEAIEAIKADPSSFRMHSGSGIGGVWHLAAIGMLQAAGVDPSQLVVVPGQGAAEAMQNLAAGAVDFAPSSVVEASTMIEAGKVRSLAVMAAERIPAFPDVPTVEESAGFPYEMGTWRGIAGPVGLPDEVVTTMATTLGEINDDAAFQEFMNSRGFGMRYLDSAAFAEFLAANYDEVGDIVEAAGLAK